MCGRIVSPVKTTALGERDKKVKTVGVGVGVTDGQIMGEQASSGPRCCAQQYRTHVPGGHSAGKLTWLDGGPGCQWHHDKG